MEPEPDETPLDDPVLDKLIELERNDKLEPETVVSEATDPGSPLYTHFEWDDSTAAHEWRLQQARQLIRRYKIIITEPDGTTFRYRRFTHVDSVGRYHDTDRALRDWRDEVLDRARRDFETWQLRYQRLGLAAQRQIIDDTLGGDGESDAA